MSERSIAPLATIFHHRCGLAVAHFDHVCRATDMTVVSNKANCEAEGEVLESEEYAAEDVEEKSANSSRNIHFFCLFSQRMILIRGRR